MTPHTAADSPAAGSFVPTAPEAPAGQLVYVYDPTDPGRNGAVQDARAGLAEDLDRADQGRALEELRRIDLELARLTQG